MHASSPSGCILKLCAFLVRESAGLEDMEPVTLESGASVVRQMAIDARRELDVLREKISEQRRCIDTFVGADELRK